jgi:hypothetical protein
MSVLTYIARRLAEPSTQVSLGALVAGGIKIAAGDYITGVPLVAGAIGGIFVPEAKPDPNAVLQHLSALSDDELRARLRAVNPTVSRMGTTNSAQ